MRAKTLLLGGIALAGAGALLAGSQPWVAFGLETATTEYTVTGHEANAALSPVSIAIVAGALALTIAGSIFRRVLGALIALLGAGVAAIAIGAASDPLAAVAGRATELTGLADGTSELTGVALTPWSYVTAVAGAVTILLGIAVLVFSGRWGSAGGKYDSGSTRRGGGGAARGSGASSGTDDLGSNGSEGAPAEPARTGTAGGDRISDWDALSSGEDPTDTE